MHANTSETIGTTPKARQPRRLPAYDPSSFIVQRRHLRQVVGVSPVTVWRLLAAGDFPPAIRLTAGRIGWRRTDLEAWLRDREAK